MLWLSSALLSNTGWAHYSCFLYLITYITLHVLDTQALLNISHWWLLLFQDKTSVLEGCFFSDALVFRAGDAVTQWKMRMLLR